jgi:hypothetical protein
MDENSGGKNEVKVSIFIRDIKDIPFDDLNPFRPFLCHLHGVILGLDSIEVLKSHPLEAQELISDIASHFKEPHGAIKSTQELEVHLCPGHSEMTLVEFFHRAERRSVPLRIFLAKTTSPFFELSILFPHLPFSSQILT